MGLTKKHFSRFTGTGLLVISLLSYCLFSGKLLAEDPPAGFQLPQSNEKYSEEEYKGFFNYFMGFSGFSGMMGTIARLNHAMQQAAENPMDKWKRIEVQQAVAAMPQAIMGLAEEFKKNNFHNGDFPVMQQMLGGFINVDAAAGYEKFLKKPDASLIPQLGEALPADALPQVSNAAPPSEGALGTASAEAQEATTFDSTETGSLSGTGEFVNLKNIAEAVDSVSEAQPSAELVFDESVSKGSDTGSKSATDVAAELASSPEFATENSTSESNLSGTEGIMLDMMRDIASIIVPSDSNKEEEERKEDEGSVLDLETEDLEEGLKRHKSKEERAKEEKEKKAKEAKEKSKTKNTKTSQLKITPQYWRPLASWNLVMSLLVPVAHAANDPTRELKDAFERNVVLAKKDDVDLEEAVNEVRDNTKDEIDKMGNLTSKEKEYFKKWVDEHAQAYKDKGGPPGPEGGPDREPPRNYGGQDRGNNNYGGGGGGDGGGSQGGGGGGGGGSQGGGGFDQIAQAAAQVGMEAVRADADKKITKMAKDAEVMQTKMQSETQKALAGMQAMIAKANIAATVMMAKMKSANQNWRFMQQLVQNSKVDKGDREERRAERMSEWMRENTMLTLKRWQIAVENQLDAFKLKQQMIGQSTLIATNNGKVIGNPRASGLSITNGNPNNMALRYGSSRPPTGMVAASSPYNKLLTSVKNAQMGANPTIMRGAFGPPINLISTTTPVIRAPSGAPIYVGDIKYAPRSLLNRARAIQGEPVGRKINPNRR